VNLTGKGGEMDYLMNQVKLLYGTEAKWPKSLKKLLVERSEQSDVARLEKLEQKIKSILYKRLTSIPKPKRTMGIINPCAKICENCAKDIGNPVIGQVKYFGGIDFNTGFSRAFCSESCLKSYSVTTIKENEQ
jgi:hypothetical protein